MLQTVFQHPKIGPELIVVQFQLFSVFPSQICVETGVKDLDPNISRRNIS